MNLQRFQAIVLRLGNQMFVRHYLWLNYPQDPQLMGIQFEGASPPPKRARTCNCGERSCKTCSHREYMRERRPVSPDGCARLRQELSDAGFTWSSAHKCWTIQRSEA